MHASETTPREGGLSLLPMCESNCILKFQSASDIQARNDLLYDGIPLFFTFDPIPSICCRYGHLQRALQVVDNGLCQHLQLDYLSFQLEDKEASQAKSTPF